MRSGNYIAGLTLITMRLSLIVAIGVLASCEPSREQKTLDWIKNAHKPVYVRGYGWMPNGGKAYLLRDADSCELSTGPVNLTLKDTIK